MFLRAVSIAFSTSLGLFGATFLLPLYFQLVLGFDAATSALLEMRFNAGLAAAGVTQAIDLGSLRHGGSGLAALGTVGLHAARAALASGFQLGFGVCAALLACALAIAAGLRDLPLHLGDIPKGLGH